MIDNFDSFTFNLVHFLENLGASVEIKRNNEINIKEIIESNPTHIVLSPGPGSPDNSGVCIKVVEQLKGVIPILGVCLGHQVIGQVFGAKICLAPKVMHGKVSSISHNAKGIFKKLPQKFNATRYHSLTIDLKSLPSEITKTAWSSDKDENNEVLMAIEVEGLTLYGVQFHPESVASEYGETLLKEFLKSKA